MVHCTSTKQHLHPSVLLYTCIWRSEFRDEFPEFKLSVMMKLSEDVRNFYFLLHLALLEERVWERLLHSRSPLPDSLEKALDKDRWFGSWLPCLQCTYQECSLPAPPHFHLIWMEQNRSNVNASLLKSEGQRCGNAPHLTVHPPSLHIHGQSQHLVGHCTEGCSASGTGRLFASPRWNSATFQTRLKLIPILCVSSI